MKIYSKFNNFYTVGLKFKHYKTHAGAPLPHQELSMVTMVKMSSFERFHHFKAAFLFW
jgi:hypothetical protein